VSDSQFKLDCLKRHICTLVVSAITCPILQHGKEVYVYEEVASTISATSNILITLRLHSKVKDDCRPAHQHGHDGLLSHVRPTSRASAAQHDEIRSCRYVKLRRKSSDRAHLRRLACWRTDETCRRQSTWSSGPGLDKDTLLGRSGGRHTYLGRTSFEYAANTCSPQSKDKSYSSKRSGRLGNEGCW